MLHNYKKNKMIYRFCGPNERKEGRSVFTISSLMYYHKNDDIKEFIATILRRCDDLLLHCGPRSEAIVEDVFEHMSCHVHLSACLCCEG